MASELPETLNLWIEVNVCKYIWQILRNIPYWEHAYSVLILWNVREPEHYLTSAFIFPTFVSLYMAFIHPEDLLKNLKKKRMVVS